MANPSQATTGDDAILDAYCDRLQATFDRARAATGCRADRTFTLAGEEVRLRFASEALAKILTPALAHLPAVSFSSGLDVLCWEGDAPDVQLPPLPWAWPEKWRNGSRYRPCQNPHFVISDLRDSEAIVLLRTDTGQAFFWTRCVDRLPTWHFGSPLLAIFSAWACAHGLILAHAACVGTERGGVLLVGKGGSGKSTTSLLCAEAGLRYLSDDYCVVQPGPVPIVFSLYNTGKLLRAKLPQMPRLAGYAIEPSRDAYDKPVIHLNRVPGIAVETQLPLRAILVPVVTGGPGTTVAPTTEAQALLALAPSTIFQLQNNAPDFFRAMGALVRRVPCFRLNLGTRFDEIPPSIHGLLKRLP